MGGWDGGAPNARTKITAAVFGTNGKVHDASDHVEEECGAKNQPQLKETGDPRTRCFRNLVYN